MSISKGMLAAVFTALVFIEPIGARAAISGNGQTVFDDIPVAPGSFPDYSPSEFALRGGKNSKPQAFNYGIRTDRASVLNWYLRRLPELGWHIRDTKRNYPRKGIDAIIADRRGEALTVVLSSVMNATKVNVVKLVSTK